MTDYSLLVLPSEDEYRKVFLDNYCEKSPLLTWDGLPVEFYPEMFDHAFYKRSYKSLKAKKDSLDVDRCQRIMWIKAVLNDPDIIPLVGYDSYRGQYDTGSRIALVSEERYVVVIRNVGKKWRFVTAYLIDNEKTYKKILSSPHWATTACV